MDTKGLTLDGALAGVLRRWKEDHLPPLLWNTSREIPWPWTRLRDLRDWMDAAYQRAAMLPASDDKRPQLPATYDVFNGQWLDRWIADNRRSLERQRR